MNEEIGNDDILSAILNTDKEVLENDNFDYFENKENENSDQVEISNEDLSSLRNQQTSIEKEESSETDEIVLSVIWQKGQIGAAFYSLEKSQISFIGDVHDSKPDFIVTRNLYAQCRPRYLITLSRMTGPFIQTLIQLTKGDSEVLRILPGRDFPFLACERRARDIKLPSVPDEASEEETRLHLLSVIDWSCSVAVHALGILLRYLDRFYSELAMCAHGTPPPILALEPVHLNSLVHMDMDTMAGLQIFSDSGSQDFNRGNISYARQGLSLLGILNRTRSRLGSQRLRSLLLQPTNDKSILEARYDLIEWACDPANKEVVNLIHQCIRHIRDPTSVITRLGGGRPMPRDWKALHRTLYHALLAAAHLKTHRHHAVLLEEIVAARQSKLDHALFCLTRILDFENASENNMNIREGIVPRLDNLRIQREGLPAMLTKVAQEELSHLPASVQHCSVHYIPEMGFLLTLPLSENSDGTESSFNLENEVQGLEHIFNAGLMSYYKSQRMRELDSQLGDTQREIWCIEAAIMFRLVQFVQIQTPQLMSLVRPLTELDALLAMSIITLERGYVRPKLIEQPSIIVKGGRHPLQELCVDSFVPNDIHITNEKNRILLLTGANAAGKSVYLKQVGLITFMAHVGCFIPAESASLGLVDAIYSRIHSIESTAKQLSAFMLDLRQVSIALRGATGRSLVLLDEFGKGTHELDGISLFVATIDNWAQRGLQNCPHLLISTHLITAARLLMQKNYPHLEAKRFEHMLDHDGQLVYLYRLETGIAEASQALLTAANVGVPEALISRAREVNESLDLSSSDLKPLSVPANRLRSMIELGRSFLDPSYSINSGNDVAELKERLSLLISHNDQPPIPPPPTLRFSPARESPSAISSSSSDLRQNEQTFSNLQFTKSLSSENIENSKDQNDSPKQILLTNRPILAPAKLTLGSKGDLSFLPSPTGNPIPSFSTHFPLPSFSNLVQDSSSEQNRNSLFQERSSKFSFKIPESSKQLETTIIPATPVKPKKHYKKPFNILSSSQEKNPISTKIRSEEFLSLPSPSSKTVLPKDPDESSDEDHSYILQSFDNKQASSPPINALSQYTPHVPSSSRVPFEMANAKSAPGALKARNISFSQPYFSSPTNSVPKDDSPSKRIKNYKSIKISFNQTII